MVKNIKNTNTNTKLITCITSHETLNVIAKLERKKIFTSNTTTNRGTSSDSKENDKAIRVLSVIVNKNEADEIFRFLYNIFRMYEQNNGFIYQQSLSNMTNYVLPNKKELEQMKIDN